MCFSEVRNDAGGANGAATVGSCQRGDRQRFPRAALETARAGQLGAASGDSHDWWAPGGYSQRKLSSPRIDPAADPDELGRPFGVAIDSFRVEATPRRQRVWQR